MPLVCAQCGQENPDGFRFCGACGASLAEAVVPREVRKTVTILFCDLVGSTSLGERTDPETLRALMGRFHAELRTVLERHGGTVEKFIGDAVMAIFGVPQSHEDDALRAVRAAAEIRDVVESIGVEVRIGVNTGQVVAGDGETLATGDAVNVAARLEQVAQAGEILIGAETQRLVRDAVEVEALEPLALKGKDEGVAAFRLLSVDPDASGVARRLDAPLVGRERERTRLRSDFDQVLSDRRCHMFTLLGTAGVGKSRLVADFLEHTNGESLVLRGRCLHYGDGITYWPLVEVLLQLGAAPDDVIGGSPAETQLSFRKLLERHAAEQPVVVVLDDLHWAEPVFLDLVEHISDWSRDAPIFLLCVARPELLDLRPAWGGGKLNATAVLLEPLSGEETGVLIDTLLGNARLEGDTRAQILTAAAGNPLFVEEMIAMVREDGSDGALTVPPTIHALLQARLDRLGTNERAVIERGAVEGQVFHRGAIEELAPELTEVSTNLLTLVRKELIGPSEPTFPDEDAFRFRHLLIRDAAYESLPKVTRATLHERFAHWLDGHGDLVEQDEIVGYHLEQAALYRGELDHADADLAARAAERLAAAGRGALDRADYAAGAKLLERAAALLPSGDRSRAAILVDLADALTQAGRFDEARGHLSEALASDDELIRAHARLLEDDAAAATGGDFDPATAAEVLPVFERHGDELGIARALSAQATVLWARCRAGDAAKILRAALEHAERAGSPRLLEEIHRVLVGTLVHGPTPAAEAEEELDRLGEGAAGRLLGEASIARARVRFAAMRGDFDAARRQAGPARQVYLDAGMAVLYAATASLSVFIEEGAGDYAAEERILHENLERLDALGERLYFSTLAITLAICLTDLGRNDEALEWAGLARERSPAGDLVNFISADAIEACVLARRGEHERAEQLGRDAVARGEETDFWVVRGLVHQTFGEVLAHAGRTAEARAEYEAAVRIYEQKGALPWAERARRLRAEL